METQPFQRHEWWQLRWHTMQEYCSISVLKIDRPYTMRMLSGEIYVFLLISIKVHGFMTASSSSFRYTRAINVSHWEIISLEAQKSQSCYPNWCITVTTHYLYCGHSVGDYDPIMATLRETQSGCKSSHQLFSLEVQIVKSQRWNNLASKMDVQKLTIFSFISSMGMSDHVRSNWRHTALNAIRNPFRSQLVISGDLCTSFMELGMSLGVEMACLMLKASVILGYMLS